MASTSQTFHGSCKVKVTILASEWGSSKEELSILNRELAIQLAKCPEVEITVFLLGERRFFSPFPPETPDTQQRSHEIWFENKKCE